MQLNVPYVKWILHLVPVKNIIFKSSYNCIYHWLFVLIISYNAVPVSLLDDEDKEPMIDTKII